MNLTIVSKICRRLWCIGLLAGLTLQAATPITVGSYALKVAADRPEALYARGDEAVFTLTLGREGQALPPDAEVRWVVTKDGVPLGREGVAKLQDGKATVRARLDEPGFLRCTADFVPAGETKLVAHAGAAYAPLAIAASLPPPADFDGFWAGQMELLAGTPANVRLTPVKSPLPGVECFDLQADIPGWAPLSAYLARPVGAQARTLPAIVLTHGAGVVKSRLSRAAECARDGFVALDFNANGLPNDQPPEFYAELRSGRLKEYYLKGRDHREEMYLRGIFLRLMRALETVTAQPEWDGRQLVVSGRSQGGGQAIVAAGLDPRVTFIAAEIPAFCDLTGVVIGRINGWPHLLPDVPGKPDPARLEVTRYYDAMNFATRTKAAAFFTVGFIDAICPPTGVYATYNQLTGPKQIWNHVDTGHVSRLEYDARIRAEILRHIASAAAKSP
ncbi:MAG: acetylxylan esterase [Lacunisphaera sp.]|nr:acetylxylan esterase [Lacunisphaera sp.]